MYMTWAGYSILNNKLIILSNKSKLKQIVKQAMRRKSKLGSAKRESLLVEMRQQTPN